MSRLRPASRRSRRLLGPAQHDAHGDAIVAPPHPCVPRSDGRSTVPCTLPLHEPSGHAHALASSVFRTPFLSVFPARLVPVTYLTFKSAVSLLVLGGPEPAPRLGLECACLVYWRTRATPGGSMRSRRPAQRTCQAVAVVRAVESQISNPTLSTAPPGPAPSAQPPRPPLLLGSSPATTLHTLHGALCPEA